MAGKSKIRLGVAFNSKYNRISISKFRKLLSDEYLMGPSSRLQLVPACRFPEGGNVALQESIFSGMKIVSA